MNLPMILKAENYSDADWVDVKSQEERIRLLRFLHSINNSNYDERRENNPMNSSDGFLIPFEGTSISVSRRWFGIDMAYRMGCGLKRWNVDDFIRHYFDLNAEEKHQARIERGLNDYFRDVNLCQFVDDLQSLFGRIVFHIPHASLELPQSFFTDCDFSDSIVMKHYRQEAIETTIRMGDVLLLDLVRLLPYPKVVAPYSRIYCDVEKYWDESKEPMARYGMGAVYRKDDRGRTLHQQTPTFMKEAKAYYDRCHETLCQTVMDTCQKDNLPCLLIDLHSFGEGMANVFAKGPYPDVCLGYNEGQRDPLLLDLAERYCRARGLSYAENFPYSGAMTLDRPTPFPVHSFMVEINKRVYL